MIRRTSRATLALSGLLACITCTRGAHADAAAPPPVDANKRVTVGFQLLSALLTQRFGLELTTRIADNHAFVVLPYYVYFTSLDYVALIEGTQSQTKDVLEGKGLEFGYRYRTGPVSRSAVAVARFYGDARVLASEYMLRHVSQDTPGAARVEGPVVPYSRRGFAAEIGAEATLAPCFYFALSFGLEYAWTSNAFDGAEKLAATEALYGDGLRPRIGGATGFTF